MTTQGVTSGHTIEIFSADCPLCRHVVDVVELGKCAGCTEIVHDTNRMTDEVKAKMQDYGIDSVPTIVIDGEVKVVGTPDFPWLCDDRFYERLRKEYPLR